MSYWVPCIDFPKYEVSNDGLIRNRKTGRILKTQTNQRGYEVVQLHDNNTPYNKKVHRLIADAFYDGDHEGLDVNHIDGNKLNNHLSNLEWCTRQENSRHAFDNGLNYSHRRKRVRIVETGEEFESHTDCAKRLGVDKRSVSYVISGEMKTCKKYHLEEI